MHEIRRGAGRKLLLVHGLGGSWQSWDTIMGPLSAERAVIAIDLPGHGATPADHDSGTFDGLVGSVGRKADSPLTRLQFRLGSLSQAGDPFFAQFPHDPLQVLDASRQPFHLLGGDTVMPRITCLHISLAQ